MAVISLCSLQMFLFVTVMIVPNLPVYTLRVRENNLRPGIYVLLFYVYMSYCFEGIVRGRVIF